jgi:hypothetical protein
MITDMGQPILHAEIEQLDELFSNINQRTEALNKEFVDKKDKKRKKNKKKHTAKLISPLQKNAFTEPVLHEVVLSKIDFELSDEVWDAINDGFGYYWNEKVGYGNTPYFNDACDTIYANIKEQGLIFPFDNVVKIVDIMFDFIEQIPGATLDDSEVVIPERNDD